MTGYTPLPNQLPYLLATDDVAGLDEWSLALITRLEDLLLQRQGGTDSITPSAANTDTTKRINFNHSYPSTPRVVVSFREALVPGSSVLWATAPDTTGFTLGIRSTNTANRLITWIAMPSSF